MRELIFNHCSVTITNDIQSVQMLTNIASAMAILVKEKYSPPALRARKQFHEIRSTPQKSLHQIMHSLKASGARDEHLFLCRMTSKLSFLSGLDPNVTERFGSCESIEPDEDPLLLCALTSGVLVSFPAANYNQPTLEVQFNELSDAGEITTATETIDNIVNSSHATSLLSQPTTHHLNSNTPPIDIWIQRNAAFPYLNFSPDIEKQLYSIQQGDVNHIISKLQKLNETALQWPITKKTTPPWACKVVPEKPNTLSNPKLYAARVFNSCLGNFHLFEWHAKFTGGGRIHLRFTLDSFFIEVGYIGKHLPLT